MKFQNRGDFLALRSNSKENSPELGSGDGVDGSGASVLFPPEGLLKLELLTNNADGGKSTRLRMRLQNK